MQPCVAFGGIWGIFLTGASVSGAGCPSDPNPQRLSAADKGALDLGSDIRNASSKMRPRRLVCLLFACYLDTGVCCFLGNPLLVWVKGKSTILAPCPHFEITHVCFFGLLRCFQGIWRDSPLQILLFEDKCRLTSGFSPFHFSEPPKPAVISRETSKRNV